LQAIYVAQSEYLKAFRSSDW